MSSLTILMPKCESMGMLILQGREGEPGVKGEKGISGLQVYVTAAIICR